LDRDKILRKSYSLGMEYEAKMTGCAQCALAAIQDALDIRNDAIFKAATGLSGGLGFTSKGSCGALAAGTLVISQCYGRDLQHFHDPEKIRLRSLRLSKKLLDRFIEEYGSDNCGHVQKRLFGKIFDFWKEEDTEEFKRLRGYSEKCASVVGNVAKWTVEIILDEEGK
jgi:C_GCAxxG_C_C family probable redox protein